MKRRRFNFKFFLTALGLICTISVAAGAAVYPKIRAIVHLRGELADSSQEFVESQKAIVAVAKYKLEERHQIENRLAALKAELPADEDVPGLLAAMNEAAKNAGVTEFTIVTRSAEEISSYNNEKLAEVRRLPVQIVGRAPYRVLGLFADQLMTARRLIVMKMLTTQQARDDSNLLEFDIEAEAYFLSAQDATPGAPSWPQK